MTQTVPISGPVLKWAREEAGLSRAELASKVRIDVDDLKLWESDKAKPTRGEFTRLVQRLGRPSAIFFMNEAPKNAGMPTSLRKAPALGKHALGPEETKQIRWARRLQEITSWVFDDAGDAEVDLPTFDLTSDPFEAGTAYRNTSRIGTEEQLGWANASEAFREWRQLLEDIGIVVLQLSMGKKNIRGFSAWDRYVPIVAVNTAYHPTARNYTLMHEVAHLLTRTEAACQHFVRPGPYDGNVERWCEQFAAAFLVPKDGLTRVAAYYNVTETSRVSDPDVARLMANRFSVSTRAMALRLKEVGLAADGLYGAVDAQLASRDWNGGGGGGGGQPASEKRIGQLGTRLPTALFGAAARGRMNQRDLADYLNLKTGQVDDLKGLLIEA